MGASRDRKSNFELLRILLILGVIVLHYSNANMGGGLKYVENGSMNYYLLTFIVSVNICAVNLFVLLSGYFMCDNNTRDIQKPIDLILKVMVFSLGTYCLQCFMGKTFTLKGVLRSLIPVNYFVILYIVLYIISPFINIVIKNVKCENLID